MHPLKGSASRHRLTLLMEPAGRMLDCRLPQRIYTIHLVA